MAKIKPVQLRCRNVEVGRASARSTGEGRNTRKYQMSIDTGGPAFPVTIHNYAYPESAGMTLRDYFAAKAMQGLMGRVWDDIPAEVLFKTWAVSAYAMADAMLKAREESNGS
jgi:hypothetical protein